MRRRARGGRSLVPSRDWVVAGCGEAGARSMRPVIPLALVPAAGPRTVGAAWLVQLVGPTGWSNAARLGPGGRAPASFASRSNWVGGTRSGIRSRQASPEAEPSAGTITVVIRRFVPGVQAWRACSMLIAAEI